MQNSLDMPLMYVRGGRDKPVVSTVASPELRSLLSKCVSESIYSLAEAAIVHQLDASKLEQATIQKSADKMLSDYSALFGVTLPEGYNFGENPISDVKFVYELAPYKPGKNAWTWDKLPYTVRCAGLARATKDENAESPKGQGSSKKRGRTMEENEYFPDVDEWVLSNEKHLRNMVRTSKLNKRTSFDWKHGLLRINDFPTIFSSFEELSKDGPVEALKIPRPARQSLPGWAVLDQKRTPHVYLQPSVTAFQQRFDSMTANILKGLDWNNVFIAGGVVLGALLTPEVSLQQSERSLIPKPEDWIASDIDMYIYGLTPHVANAKIKHIADLYKNNLPKDAPFLVVRNSQTITFYSAWPTRRVQIVLKLVSCPSEVLLNFDLDICAVGWDGSELWMLPRCARALETGTNVFTMDLINGHYLGERKATRDKRVFKYAKKGFGIRILPSYVATLSSYTNHEMLKDVARGEELFDPPLSLDGLAETARKWTTGIVTRYLKHGHTTISKRWPQFPVNWPASSYDPPSSNRPVFSHAMLESYAQTNAEPLGRSCLTGFSLFMRHVALWEEEVNCRITIYEDIFATDTYGEGPRIELGYDDTPAYCWDDKYNIEEFKRAIDEFNKKEQEAVSYNFNDSRFNPTKFVRVAHAESVDEILSPDKDIIIPLVMTCQFCDFANNLIHSALSDVAPKLVLDVSDCKKPISLIEVKNSYRQCEEEKLFAWRLDSVLNWQMIDRRIDEVREALWSMHRANERMMVDPNERTRLFMTEISRRAVRMTETDEMDAFVRWVGRQPYHHGPQSFPNQLWLRSKGDLSVESDDDCNHY